MHSLDPSTMINQPISLWYIPVKEYEGYKSMFERSCDKERLEHVYHGGN